MRTSEAFVLGVITGAVVVWLWGREIENYVGEKTRGMRAKAAEGLRAVEERTGKMLDHGGGALRDAGGAPGGGGGPARRHGVMLRLRPACSGGLHARYERGRGHDHADRCGSVV